MSMAIPNHNVGQVFLNSEGEEGQELKGSVTVILRFCGEFSAESFGGITTRTLTTSAM